MHNTEERPLHIARQVEIVVERSSASAEYRALRVSMQKAITMKSKTHLDPSSHGLSVQCQAIPRRLH